jgi:hypothetical protein
LLWVLGPGMLFLALETKALANIICRSWYQNSTEIKFFQNGEGEVTFSNVNVSEGLFEAWPERA